MLEPMKVLALSDIPSKRLFGLKVLAKLGLCDSVKKTFVEVLASNDGAKDALYVLIKMDKGCAREIAVEVIKTEIHTYVKTIIIRSLGVIGDSNTLLVLKGIEQSNDNSIKAVANQARGYLEYRLNLPTQEQQKSWADQAYIYWSVPYRYVRPVAINYRGIASFMFRSGHRFSSDFLMYHIKQRDYLAAAIIGYQAEQGAMEDSNDLKACLNEVVNEPNSYFKDLCLMALESIEKQEIKEPRDPNTAPN
jgi:hypothetical protein